MTVHIENEAASIQAAVAGKTLPSEFLAFADRHPGATALRWLDEAGRWKQLTFREYADEVARYAAAYRRIGIGAGSRIVLMMRNIPEFHIADLAATFVRATPISIFNSSSPEQIAYVVRHSNAELAVVEDKTFLDRFLTVRSELPPLRHLAVLAADAHTGHAGVLGRDELLAGDASGGVDLHELAAAVRPDDTATIIYTSGTTGDPKGVVLSHENIVFTVESLRRATGVTPEDLLGHRVVSYLPMAHIAERAVSHYQGSLIGYEITCCPDMNRLAEYLVLVRPQIMFGVPRVWEKIQSGVEAAVSADPERKAKFDEGVAAAIPIAEAIDWGSATDDDVATWQFLDAVAFQQVRSLLGLDECEFAVSGAAPLRPDLVRWFRAVGVPISEIYGMSETSGPMAWAPRRVKAGTVGPPLPGTEMRTAGDGELLLRGGNIFTGYLDDPARTAEAFDDEGWLHTGDIAEVDEDGYWRIVDRKKELLITAGGKNVSPANLEAALKSIPLVAQACAVGDRRPFVGALVTLDPEVAPVWAAQHGIGELSLDELARHPAVVAEIERGVEEVMEPFSRAEAVRKVRVLGDEWQPDGDLLTPTAKLKRRSILARYVDEIDALYAQPK